MKKSPRRRASEIHTSRRPRSWWLWVAAPAGLILALGAYSPSLDGPFVLDDQYLPYGVPDVAQSGFLKWISGTRPLLMASYWLNYQWSGDAPYSYHLSNVLLHFLGSAVCATIAVRLMGFAGVNGPLRTVLGLFAGGLFLLHPLQTESVAYVAGRSEALSVLFYYSAFAVFLYRQTDNITWPRAVAVVGLFGLATVSKEHTLTFPFLLLMTDWWWGRGGIRKNALLYGPLAAAGVAGAVYVGRIVASAETVGFELAGLSPKTYFFTQCRVLWMYVRLFLLPFGQNVDPDIALSPGLLDHSAWAGLLALLALITVAWVFRKRWPLAAFGVLVFLLLIAPTSSVVPIRDVMAERRLYLPFLGLALISLEALRRLKVSAAIGTAVAVLTLCGTLTYQRSEVWASPLALWQDTATKSPRKVRPRFQLAFAYYEQGQCPQAAENFERAAQLGPPDVPLLVDWALALDCAGRPEDAIVRLKQAGLIEDTAHIHAQIGMIYGKQGRMPEALEALAEAEKLDPRFEMTYVYRGNVFEVMGDRAAAGREYKRALEVNPGNSVALQALGRLGAQ
jgi:tetratricopeptide (TPR) repeat protein